MQSDHLGQRNISNQVGIPGSHREWSYCVYKNDELKVWRNIAGTTLTRFTSLKQFQAVKEEELKTVFHIEISVDKCPS
jgi:hypothetical protein